MNKSAIIIIIAVLIAATMFELFGTQKEICNENLEKHIIEKTIFTIVSDPNLIFRLLEMSPEWEAINAVPYSKCYRHLQGSTMPMTSDYIMCQAI